MTPAYLVMVQIFANLKSQELDGFQLVDQSSNQIIVLYIFAA